MMSDAKAEGFRRIEVLTGPRRRRDWSEDDKARAVAESCAPGAGALSFVPVVGDAAAPVPSPAGGEMGRAAVEVEIAGAVVRVLPGVDDGLLTAVLRAVRASAA